MGEVGRCLPDVIGSFARIDGNAVGLNLLYGVRPIVIERVHRLPDLQRLAVGGEDGMLRALHAHAASVVDGLTVVEVFFVKNQ